MDKTALLKKIRALAEHGVGGEAENAEKLLARMMKKYGISEAELDEETRVRHDFTYHGGEEKKILKQVVYKVTGGYTYELVYTAAQSRCTPTLRKFTRKCGVRSRTGTRTLSPHSRRSSSGVPVFSPRNGRKRPPSQKSLLSASRTIKEVAQMKKLYSKKLGGEAFALDAAQLDTLKKAGYTVPSPEEVIADAAAVKIEPPEGKRAYVVFDFKTGAFKVRTRTQTLAESEVGGFVGEVVSAAILCGFVERADMDKPKADAPATPTTASPLVNMLRDAFLRAANNKTAPAADKPAEAADAPEVVE